ncbi:hypothetical protein [Spirillospora sp. CA-294931]
MSTSLANPRRTKIVAWPGQGSEAPEPEESGASDSAPAGTDD